MDRKADFAIQSLTEVVSPRMSNMTRRCQDRVHGDALKSLEKLTSRADCGSRSRMKPIIIFEQKNKATYWIYQQALVSCLGQGPCFFKNYIYGNCM